MLSSDSIKYKDNPSKITGKLFMSDSSHNDCSNVSLSTVECSTDAMLYSNCDSIDYSHETCAVNEVENEPRKNHSDFDSTCITGGWWQMPLSDRVLDCHYIGGLRSQMNYRGWMHELSFEPDQKLCENLQEGITNGFRIVDSGSVINSYECDDYKSVLEGPAKEYISSLLDAEISEGKYIAVDKKPHLVHGLGASG